VGTNGGHCEEERASGFCCLGHEVHSARCHNVSRVFTRQVSWGVLIALHCGIVVDVRAGIHQDYATLARLDQYFRSEYSQSVALKPAGYGLL